MARAASGEMRERWCAIATVLGTVLVCGTPDGVRRVILPAPDSSQPPSELPGLRDRSGRAFSSEVGPVIAALARGDTVARHELPTIAWGAVHGFTRAVLEYVSTIPRGAVRTYGEVASALGRPGAARAVGQALRANPVPLLVPCHRVVAADGSLGGFSAGGRRQKERLLEAEGALRRDLSGPTKDAMRALVRRAR